MMRFEVLRETTDRGGTVDAFTVTMWLDVAEVFSVQADPDPRWSAGWSVLAFKPTAGRRPMTVEGVPETVAALITAERRRERRPARRVRA